MTIRTRLYCDGSLVYDKKTPGDCIAKQRCPQGYQIVTQQARDAYAAADKLADAIDDACGQPVIQDVVVDDGVDILPAAHFTPVPADDLIDAVPDGCLHTSIKQIPLTDNTLGNFFDADDDVSPVFAVNFADGRGGVNYRYSHALFTGYGSLTRPTIVDDYAYVFVPVSLTDYPDIVIANQ